MNEEFEVQEVTIGDTTFGYLPIRRGSRLLNALYRPSTKENGDQWLPYGWTETGSEDKNENLLIVQSFLEEKIKRYPPG